MADSSLIFLAFITNTIMAMAMASIIINTRLMGVRMYPRLFPFITNKADITSPGSTKDRSIT